MSVGAIEASDPRWDRFVVGHSDATVYHLAAWSEILRRAYRFRPCHLAAFGENGELRGVLPMMRKRGPVTGHKMRSLPAIEIGGPLAVDDDARRELLSAACEQARASGCSMLIDSSRGGLERDVDDLVAVPRPPTWVAAMPDPEAGVDSWLRDRSSNLRRGVKRARSRGVRVRHGRSDADLRTFHRLYVATMRKHRSLPRPLRQLELEWDLLGPEHFKVFLAEVDGTTLAAGVFHRFGDTLELLYNGSDEAALDMRPNHALYAHVVGWAAINGVRRLDYGYAWPKTSLAGFKQQWGAEEEPRHRYALAAAEDAGTGENADTSVDRLPARLIDAAWGRAPLALTRAAGAVAYRYL